MRNVRATVALFWGLCALAPLLAACDGGPSTVNGADTVRTDTTRRDSTPVASGRVPVYVADVVQAWPHDRGAFTQGLVWHESRLFEGTGIEGRSTLRETALQSGAVLRRRDLDAQHFGEGIAIVGDDLYQLTWVSGRAFVYDWRTFTLKRELRYGGEGWGLTTDGQSLVMSNGTAVIVWRDPATFAETKRITVTENGTPVMQLNELEWVKGELWANVWLTDRIARIDPSTGRVTGWIDLGGLLPATERNGSEDVLNGIAYDATGDRLFVTGKLWPKLYEIRLRLRS